MKKRQITLDEKSEAIVDALVPAVYPTRSECLRDLLRREAERRALA